METSQEQKRQRKNLLQRARREKALNEKPRASIIIKDAEREAARIIEAAMQECDEQRSVAEACLAQREALVQAREDVVDNYERKIASVLAELNKENVIVRLNRTGPSEVKNLLQLAREKRKAFAASRTRKTSTRRRTSCSTIIGPDTVESNRVTSSIGRVTLLVVNHLHDVTKHFNVRAKKTVITGVLNHQSMKDFLPAALAKPRLYKSLIAGFQDMRPVLHKVKSAKQKADLVVKRSVLVSMNGKSVKSGRHISALSAFLGMKRQNLSRACGMRLLWEADNVSLQSLWVRKTRIDKVSEEVKQVIQQFWESRTRVSPNRNDTVRLRLGPKIYEEHGVHWLEDTQVEFFLQFQEWVKSTENPHQGMLSLKVGLRTFESFKPYFVRVLKDRVVCCCKQHVQMDLLKQAYNKITQEQMHPLDCSCQCSVCRPPGYNWSIAQVQPHCLAHLEPVTSVRAWLENILCPKAAEKTYHKYECLMGTCKDCGISKLEFCPMEIERNAGSLVEWKAFETIYLNKKARPASRARSARLMSSTTTSEPDPELQEPSKRLQLTDKKTTWEVFQLKLQTLMPQFIIHNFRYRWQAEAYRQCLTGFPTGTIVSTIDYAENYTFQVQNEIQSMHWVKKQISILVHITYRHRDDQNLGVFQEQDGERHIVADYHFYISDDNEHDSLFVQHCFDVHSRWSQDAGIQPVKMHYVWSDGCATQFKSRAPFYFVSRHAAEVGPTMMWNFFGSGHGKGVQDGLGGHIKSALAKEQLRLTTEGHTLQNAADAVSFLKQRFAADKEKAYGEMLEVNRHFHLIAVGDVDRRKKRDANPIRGSRKLHCFYGYSKANPCQLKMRELSCFCVYCMDLSFEHCLGKDYNTGWLLHTVIPKVPGEMNTYYENVGVGENMGDFEDTFEGGCLGHLLQIGDLYAIEAHPEDWWQVTFYVLHCLQPVQCVTEAFTDTWGQSFWPGQSVIKGRWYQPWGRKGSHKTYMLENITATESWCLAEKVIHIHFPLKPGKRHGKGSTFHMDPDTIEAIMACLE